MPDAVRQTRFLATILSAFGDESRLSPVELLPRAARLGQLFEGRDGMIEVLRRVGVPLRGDLLWRRDVLRELDALDK